MVASRPLIYWFRDDLRLSDLPGFNAAVAQGPVVPVYIFDEALSKEWALGKASRWWLHQSLKVLQDRLKSQGVQLILKKGETTEVLFKLATTLGADAVYCSRQYQPWSAPLEERLNEKLSLCGISVKRYPGALLFEPEQIKTGSGTPFRVFTPFWRSCLNRQEPKEASKLPALMGIDESISSDSLSDWNLVPKEPDWAENLQQMWLPGESAGFEALGRFLNTRVKDYSEGRDTPGKMNTSRLSPYLRFGNLSPRQVWRAAVSAKAVQPESARSIDKFLTEIGWREFSYHLLFHFPHLPEEPFNPKFSNFPWKTDTGALTKWQNGQTGYPIVDAGMRELWATGFMHNRVRMVVASFLTKHLLIDWRVGEAWFWDRLVDADLASNSAGWQWVGGSGADASPYFRIFNPVAQGEKFDKEGAYTRKWVPELDKLPDRFLHKPWEASQEILGQAGIELGVQYPFPIVDHREARARALAAYADLKMTG